MKIGDVVRHTTFGDIGIVNWVYQGRVSFTTDTGEWTTYTVNLEVIA